MFSFPFSHSLIPQVFLSVLPCRRSAGFFQGSSSDLAFVSSNSSPPNGHAFCSTYREVSVLVVVVVSLILGRPLPS